jgi:hypothetical protein
MVFGTWLSVSGARPPVAMELMRHSDLKLTMKIYTDASQLLPADSIERLPSFSVLSALNIYAGRTIQPTPTRLSKSHNSLIA